MQPVQSVRYRLYISGTVQGVGFRPFIYRLASELSLTGQICNTGDGVQLELQGHTPLLETFLTRLHQELPPLARIENITSESIPPVSNATGFTILHSQGRSLSLQIAADSAICSDCLRELYDNSDRRYRHPFITCTNCGPRWTIVTAVPYDRPLTTMAGFPLCADCAAEYQNPANRRFHAQPIACHQCGPQLSLLSADGTLLATGDQAITLTVQQLRKGKVAAVKGVGGYHLAVDACSDRAVEQLRQRKSRDEKPFAVMVPDLATALRLADMSDQEILHLQAPEAPIVIVRRLTQNKLSTLVAPGSQWVGLLMAYTPLHHLLLHDYAATGALPALVMTSANSSDEPMIADDDQALDCLAGIADCLLMHNRPVHIRTDDSVLRVLPQGPLFYRRSRGFVPHSVPMPLEATGILAVGAELKNTVCLTYGKQVFLSQHIGDLKNDSTFSTFKETINHLTGIMKQKPQTIVCDQHPDYLSTRHAEQQAHQTACELVRVQHHHAHLASCMAENGVDGQVLGVIFDGTGLGSDGTIWGGEFLLGGYDTVQRVAHLKPVPQPGGDSAARETWRMVLAWLYQARGGELWQLPGMPPLSTEQQTLFVAMLERGIQSPVTSSMGRLFDAAAFLLGAAHSNRFDGQAGMALEILAESALKAADLPLPEFLIKEEQPMQLDFTPTLLALLDNRLTSPPELLAAGFHQAVAQSVHAVCSQIRSTHGISRVALSGGVFQNRLLSSMVYTLLVEHGFEVFTQRLVPPNDGGLCLGQAAIAAYQRG